jgi:hypothetical protein
MGVGFHADGMRVSRRISATADGRVRTVVVPAGENDPRVRAARASAGAEREWREFYRGQRERLFKKCREIVGRQRERADRIDAECTARVFELEGRLAAEKTAARAVARVWRERLEAEASRPAPGVREALGLLWAAAWSASRAAVRAVCKRIFKKGGA